MKGLSAAQTPVAIGVSVNPNRLLQVGNNDDDTNVKITININKNISSWDFYTDFFTQIFCLL